MPPKAAPGEKKPQRRNKPAKRANKRAVKRAVARNKAAPRKSLGAPANAVLKDVEEAGLNGRAWASSLFLPFTEGVGMRVPDGSCQLPTYTMSLTTTGAFTIPTSTTTSELVLAVSCDPLATASQVTAITGLGAWSTAGTFGSSTFLPANTSVLTANAAVYRTVGVGLRVWSTTPVLKRGGTYQCMNAYLQLTTALTLLTSGPAPTAANFNSALQRVQGDLAALGGEGLKFTWLPATSRSSAVFDTSSSNIGCSGLGWRSPAAVATNNLKISESALLFRAFTTDNANVGMALNYEIIWNVEFIPLSASEQTFPGMIVKGSAGAVSQPLTDALTKEKPVMEQVKVPTADTIAAPVGATEVKSDRIATEPKRGEAGPLASAANFVKDFGTNLLKPKGDLFGSAANMVEDMLGGIFDLECHRMAVKLGVPDLSPLCKHAFNLMQRMHSDGGPHPGHKYPMVVSNTSELLTYTQVLLEERRKREATYPWAFTDPRFSIPLCTIMCEQRSRDAAEAVNAAAEAKLSPDGIAAALKRGGIDACVADNIANTVAEAREVGLTMRSDWEMPGQNQHCRPVPTPTQCSAPPSCTPRRA